MSKKPVISDAQKMELKITRVFMENLNLCKIKEGVLVNRGGAGSGKSHALCQLLVYKFLTEKNKKILIIRKSLPSLRISVQWLLHRIFDDFGVRERIKVEKVHLNYHFGDNIIHLGSIDDPEKMKCWPASTEILTENGFINISAIKVGDRVASLNPNTKEVDYYPISKFFEYDYDGDVYVPKKNIRGAHLDFAVTPEHKFIGQERVHKGTKNNYYYEKTDPKFIKAKDLPDRFYIPRSGKWNGTIIKNYTIPNTSERSQFNKTTTFPILPWLKFLGWFISEGSVSGTNIQISQTKKEGKKQFLEDIKDFPKDYNIGYCNTSFRMNGRSLTDYLNKEIGTNCYNKRIPRDIMKLHPSLLINLFNSLMEGDGTKTKEGRYIYSTSSEGLKDDICELALRLGFVCNVLEPRTDYPGNYLNGKKSWSISIYKQETIAMSKPITEKYKGKVYCVEVEPHHTVLTRYNGKVIWTGNSTEWNYIWMEEATEFTLDDYRLIRSRMRYPTYDGNPNQMFLSFNPIDESHWIKEKLLTEEEAIEIHSTYRDNPFLQETYINHLEELCEYDINFHRVYALGEWGRLDNLIYPNWDVCSVGMIPLDGTTVYGLDFGFNAPSALVKCTVKGKDCWEEELLYREKLTNSDLINQLKIIIPTTERQRPIYADAAEPDRIIEIKNAGFNVKPAHKNIKDGIDFVKRMKVHILDSSNNLKKEKRSYSWKTDKNNHEKVLDEPIPNVNDHLMDAERYALYSHFGAGKEFRIRWLT